MENLLRVLMMEVEALKVNFSSTEVEKEEARGKVRVLELVCDSFDAKLQSLMKMDSNFLKSNPPDLVGLKNNEARKTLLEEVVDEKKLELNTMKMEAAKLEHVAHECQRLLQLKQIMLDGVKAECELLKMEKASLGFNHTPIAYPNHKIVNDDLGEIMFLKITICSLCGFGFPKSDIIVSSCKHIYHPFCAKIVYQSGNRCADLNCTQALVDPDWFRSLGVGNINEELEQRAALLHCAEEGAQLLAERAETARLRSPNTGK